MVNILDRFEQSFERLVEGSVGRLFRSPVQPAEIGRKLERAMVSNQVVSVNSTLVPNDYRVAMHPQDMVLFVDFVPALCRQMESWLHDAAEEQGFSAIDRMRVQITGDESVPRRAIQVTAAIADRPDMGRAEQEAIQRTEIFRVIRDTSGMTPIRLRFTTGVQAGTEFIIRKPVTTLGRALDNDIVIESGDISRHHARLELADEQIRVVDLNSTNGTRVNGRAIRSQSVRTGDEVAFGTLTADVLPFQQEHR
jgi:pSer/pThr/pTyr-binding forkhead associated (FHA) protein